jgi:RPA family protein
LDKIEVGDIVLVIGRPREFSSEKYILIETIKKIDPAWTKVRELELEKNIAEHIPITKNKIPVEESIVDLNPTNKIIKLIKELDKGNGVSIEELSSKNIEGIDKMVDMLLKEGDVFEIKPGRLKVLE